MGEALLRISGLSKNYDGNTAIKHLDLHLEAGEVVAVVGANGAGKSTLLKCISGALTGWQGKIELVGVTDRPWGVRHALEAGIAMAYQDPALIRNWTIAEHFTNFSSGIDANELSLWLSGRQRSALVQALDAEECQRLEFFRAFKRAKRLVLADEPIAGMSVEGKQLILNCLSALRGAADRAALWISHDIESAIKFSSRIVVLRNGELVADLATSVASRDQVLSIMGTRHSVQREKPRNPLDTIKTRSSLLTVQSSQGLPEVKFHSGKIVGIVGLTRSGASHFLRSVVGLSDHFELSVEIDGVKIKRDPLEAWKVGVRYLSSSRSTEWLLSQQSVEFNVTISSLGRILGSMITNKGRLNDAAEQILKEHSVGGAKLAQNVESLSGGNRQKLVLARLLNSQPSFLLLDEPFSGVDFSTRALLSGKLLEHSRRGMSIVLFSQEVEDVIRICDEVLFFDGHSIRGPLEPSPMLATMLAENIFGGERK